MINTKAAIFVTIFLQYTIYSKAQISSKNVELGTLKNTQVLPSANKINIDASNLYNVEKINLPYNNAPNISLQNIISKPVSNYVLAQNITLPQSLNTIVTNGFEQKMPIAYVQFPKYFLQNGIVHELVSYTLNTVQGAEIKKTRGIRTYANNSILATGQWQKLSITETGIHKIDFNFVKNTLGIDPSSINTTLIKVCGNGGNMLSENNAIIPLDDLQQTALQLVGMQDGKWDAGDYILFYAVGPNAIIADSVNKKMDHQFNLYNNAAHYFINFNQATNGLRVNTQNNTLVPNTTINTYNYYAFYEKDSTNIGKVGKVWWGDAIGNKIGYPKSREVSFAMPNLVADSNIYVETKIGNKGVNANANFAVKAQTFNANVATALSAASNTLAATGVNIYAPFIIEGLVKNTFKGSGNSLSVNVQYTSTEDQALGYINYISVNAMCQLMLNQPQLNFRNLQAIQNASIAEYKLSSTNNVQIWDVTNQQTPTILNSSNNAGITSFVQKADAIHEFIAFDGTQFFTPNLLGTVTNQNLHNTTPADYLIITHPQFLPQANNLAQIHISKENLRTVIATTEQIYNEFGSGSQDISAIRNFIKMYYDKAVTSADLPKYVLLFGDASFDYKDRTKNNTNLVPSRESDESVVRTASYVSDDFFGMLDDNENINDNTIPNTLDIGVGRFVCSTADEAATLVQKVATYYSASSFGDWRLNQTFCADDRDNGQHVLDAEIMANEAKANQPNFNLYKIYVDAFPIFSSPAGPRAPQAKQAIDAQLFNGTLMVNYNGHGGTAGWCEERIVNTADISSYSNLDKMPIFITATCDFAPFDQPTDKSCGEQLFLHKKGGAIALLTTTAVVYQYQNQLMNRDYWKDGFKPLPNGTMPRLGDALRLSKNRTYITPNTFDNFTNFRKFVLLGDPALMPAFAQHTVVLDSVNGKNLNANIDTLKALNTYTLNGHIAEKGSGTLMQNFNGTVSISVFDKAKNVSTLQNVVESQKVNYTLQNTLVFKGKATVVNGKWSINFIVPKDIDYTVGSAKVSMYAHNGVVDAAGFESNLVKVGGSGTNIIADNDGPQIKPFMNNNKFLNGGLTSPNSTLYVELFDENGINATGASVGHDLVAFLDNNTKDPIVLNNFYEGAKDNYKNGIVRYPFKGLTEGKHTLTVRAWDVVNNSNMATVDFVVSNSNTAQIDRLLNIPNPFTTNTNFSFEHNFPNEPLYVTIQIFSTSGQVVKTIQQYVNSEGSRVNDINWDGKDQLGDKLGRGVYLYRVYYKTVTGISTSKYEKLVIL